MFSFLLCGEIMKQAGDIREDEWNFFLRGAAGMDRVSNWGNEGQQAWTG